MKSFCKKEKRKRHVRIYPEIMRASKNPFYNKQFPKEGPFYRKWLFHGPFV